MLEILIFLIFPVTITILLISHKTKDIKRRAQLHHDVMNCNIRYVTTPLGSHFDVGFNEIAKYYDLYTDTNVKPHVLRAAIKGQKKTIPFNGDPVDTDTLISVDDHALSDAGVTDIKYPDNLAFPTQAIELRKYLCSDEMLDKIFGKQTTSGYFSYSYMKKRFPDQEPHEFKDVSDLVFIGILVACIAAAITVSTPIVELATIKGQLLVLPLTFYLIGSYIIYLETEFLPVFKQFTIKGYVKAYKQALTRQRLLWQIVYLPFTLLIFIGYAIIIITKNIGPALIAILTAPLSLFTYINKKLNSSDKWNKKLFK